MAYVSRDDRLLSIIGRRAGEIFPISRRPVDHQSVKAVFEDLELNARLQEEPEDQGLRADVDDGSENQSYDLMDRRDPEHQ